MISQVRFESVTQFLFHGAPPLVVSMVTAELFFKFHSFILECTAFLALWYGLDWVYCRLPILRRAR
jgi:hypothetical protein